MEKAPDSSDAAQRHDIGPHRGTRYPHDETKVRHQAVVHAEDSGSEASALATTVPAFARDDALRRFSVGFHGFKGAAVTSFLGGETRSLGLARVVFLITGFQARHDGEHSTRTKPPCEPA